MHKSAAIILTLIDINGMHIPSNADVQQYKTSLLTRVNDIHTTFGVVEQT